MIPRSEELIQHTSTWLKQKGIPYTDMLYLIRGKKSSAEFSVDLVVEDSLEEALNLTKKVNFVLLYHILS
jgi:uncharacterized HAD superfamily protein